jgi:hypothetical protein
VRKTLRGCNVLGEAQLDVLPFHERKEPFAVSAHVAADFGEGGEFLAFGLRDVEHVDTTEPVEPGLAVFLISILGGGFFISAALLADHGSQNEDAFFAAFHEAAKRVPSANPGTLVASGFCRAMSMTLPKL